MARGYPDDGVNTESLNQHGTDLSELAARLGSLHAIRRYGNVVWMDGFENGLAPWVSDVRVPATVTVATSNVYSGGKAAALLNSATESAAIIKTIPILKEGTYGFDFVFTPIYDGSHAMGSIAVSMYYYDGVNVQQAIARINMTTGGVEIYTDIGAGFVYVPLSPALGIMYYSSTYPVNNYLHFSADFGNGFYKRLAANNRAWDLSSYPLKTTANSAPARIDYRISHMIDANAQTVNIDNVVCTIEEE